ncbi:ISAzo13 family transposase, partial [Crenothrix polyspora]|uniref:ISAzo13 family transposase n=1 Tax=Crenothrix polyspora TaxID=360316 RepID=UPI000B34B688
RAFQAQVTIDYLDSRPRKAETTFGWDRQAVALGLNELRTGIACLGGQKASGNKKTEEKNPQLEIDIVDLAEAESQVDPKFQTPFKYTRITAKAIRAALISHKGWKHEDLPCEKTIGNILNRLNYKLRRVQKTKPLKKIKETDAIFKNVKAANRESDNREDSLRISIDTKAKVDLCDSSRGGTSRCQKPLRAADHDMGNKPKLVPFGILEVLTGLLTIIFGVSFETSDFIVDALEAWWGFNKEKHGNIKQLVINLDNGPNNSGRRTQFLKRMTEFADKYELEIVLVYYPPYHSKYNAIERCWGILESHWNATLLDTLLVTVEWAKSMTWKGLKPLVEVLQTVYKKGVKITKKAFNPINDRIIRHPLLPKYCLTIQPQLT